MRLLCLIALAAPLLAAQDAREIVRRAVQLDKANDDNWRNFSYTERQYERQFESDGKVKSERLRTYQVTFQDGTPYRCLVARNDKPLSPEEQKAEQEKLQRTIEERRSESEDVRRKRIAEWRQKLSRQREPLNEIPEAFDFRIAGEQRIDGLDAWIIDATPRQGYHSKSLYTSFLPKMKARLWISKAGYRWIKLDAEVLDTVSYGAIVLRIAKGAHITMEQSPVGDGVWMPKRIALLGAARVFLVKSVRMQLDMQYSSYRRSAPEAHATMASKDEDIHDRPDPR